MFERGEINAYGPPLRRGFECGLETGGVVGRGDQLVIAVAARVKAHAAKRARVHWLDRAAAERNVDAADRAVFFRHSRRDRQRVITASTRDSAEEHLRGVDAGIGGIDPERIDGTASVCAFKVVNQL